MRGYDESGQVPRSGWGWEGSGQGPVHAKIVESNRQNTFTHGETCSSRMHDSPKSSSPGGPLGTLLVGGRGGHVQRRSRGEGGCPIRQGPYQKAQSVGLIN